MGRAEQGVGEGSIFAEAGRGSRSDEEVIKVLAGRGGNAGKRRERNRRTGVSVDLSGDTEIAAEVDSALSCPTVKTVAVVAEVGIAAKELRSGSGSLLGEH